MSETALYEKILKELKNIINENKSIKSYKLPSERMLAIKFNASRLPVRAAYQRLIEQGLVESIHGKGYFITTPKSPSFQDSTQKKQVLFVAPSIKTNFMRNIYLGMSDFCEKNNIELSVKFSDNSSKKEKQILESAYYSNYDGLILFPVDNEYYNETLLKLSISKYPAAVIDRYIKSLKLSFITTDNYTAMENIVQYLYQKKYKNLVFVTHEASTATTVEERINGYNHGLFKYYGFASAANILFLKSDDKDYIYKTIKTYLQEHPQTDALIITDVFLSLAHLAVTELNMKTPEKIRLVIFDDEVSFTESKTIKPYIISQDSYNIGYHAAQCVYSQILGEKRIVIKKFPVKIIDEDL